MIETGGTYGEGEMIYQEYCELPQYNGNNVMIGSWIADGESVGIIIRESQSPIITNNNPMLGFSD